MVGRLGWLAFGRSPLLYTSDGIRKASWKVRRHHRLLPPPTLRLSFAVEPSLTTKHVVMILPRNFPAPHSTRSIAMLQWEARVGKRDSSLAIERKTEKAKRMPRVQARSAALSMSSLRHHKVEAHPREIWTLIRLPSASRLPPSRRPSRGTPTAAVRSVGQDQHHRALVSERAAPAYAVTKIPCSGSAGLSCRRFLRLLFGVVRLRGVLLLGRGRWSS